MTLESFNLKIEDMIQLQDDSKQNNFQEEFSYRQIGSITTQADPIDAGANIEYVLTQFKENENLHAVPIERNGVLVGILERSVIEKLSESAWNRFWQKDLDKYLQAPLLTLRADDYIEKNIARVTSLNTDTGARFFAVFYRKSFFGIVGLRELLTRITELRAQDLDKARNVQQNLLAANTCSKNDKFKVITWNKMANEVGGDFYTTHAFQNNQQYIVGCFDVSGKNVAASLSTMAIGSFFTALKHFDLGKKPFSEITVLMDKFINALTPADMFITAAICYVDLDKNVVTIQNCAHTIIYLYVPDEHNKMQGKILNPNLPPLGMDILEAESKSCYQIPIEKGMRIVLYTDGLTDMVTPDGLRFEDERTKNLFNTVPNGTEEEILSYYTKNIETWINDAMLADDITIMDIRFR